ncbi:hypothetical protein I3843_03G087200 [Carya illinoinensis]|uniref:Calmodulin-binding domain-containing protein n=1 Tax=Carya illinoinensis TaxID=32201 RepID=A0A922JUH4_CARIL|nr:hypothetical protein I3842_03G087300 [Carya illinoinensis]KAG6720936.1 hypothetical protein I3842_03G087300 [Carya illinoinensis]KAG6720937.1 hypothetical protein I3842_03G087300 [Carya illinoinensis]KAG6720938.1 hypothetical protein I3842_03G087300 [Carya illinoinensis]KAG6720939.1 hypothetical protein I3842_03G087300 [Carya illinoinensis]
MGEDSVHLPVTPERTKPNVNNLRRSSTGKVSSSTPEESVLPHYLRASTGSCHDLCKYGRCHALEAKARRPMLKRVNKKACDSGSAAVSVDLPRRKETPVVKLKPSPTSKSRASHTPQIVKQEVSIQPSDRKSPMENKVLAERKKKSGVMLKSSPYSKTHTSDTPKAMKQEVPSAEKVRVSAKKGSLKAKDLDLSAKPVASLNPKSLRVEPRSFPNSTVGKSGLRKSDVKTGWMSGTSKVAANKVLAHPAAPLSSKSSVNRVANVNGRKHGDLKTVSPHMNKNKIRKAEPREPNDDKVQEKTLYVIKMETENGPLESDQNESCVIELSPALLSSPKSSSPPHAQSSSSYEEIRQEESENIASEAEDDSPSEKNGVESIEEADIVEKGFNGKSRKAGVVHSEDKKGQLLKLKFKRGKVVDSQSLTDNPRRLKFRQGKVLGENHNVKVISRRRSFKRIEVDGDTNGTKPSPQKVVLRHQDVQGKRDAQGLFNNVIEETASKLVETRKSKVKALVGAFETVISLQEKNPS